MLSPKRAGAHGLDARSLRSLSLVVAVCAVALGLIAPVARAAAGEWTATASMAIPREEHTATLLASGKVLVAGGYTLAHSRVRRVEVGFEH